MIAKFNSEFFKRISNLVLTASRGLELNPRMFIITSDLISEITMEFYKSSLSVRCRKQFSPRTKVVKLESFIHIRWRFLLLTFSKFLEFLSFLIIAYSRDFTFLLSHIFGYQLASYSPQHLLLARM